MSKQDLHEALKRLQSEVDDTSFSDPQAAQRIRELIDGIEYQLAHADDHKQRTGLQDSLSDSLGLFELQHPRLAATLNQIISTLSSMGI